MPAFKSDLMGIKLFDTQYKVCASPDYLKRTGKPEKPKDLERHKCPVFNLPQYQSHWLFKKKKAKTQRVNITSSTSISSALALFDCAINGMEPVLLADWLVDEYLSNGTLINLFPDYQVTATDFETAAWLLYPSRQYLPMKTKVMIDFLKANLVRA